MNKEQILVMLEKLDTVYWGDTEIFGEAIEFIKEEMPDDGWV